MVTSLALLAWLLGALPRSDRESQSTRFSLIDGSPFCRFILSLPRPPIATAQKENEILPGIGPEPGVGRSSWDCHRTSLPPAGPKIPRKSQSASPVNFGGHTGPFQWPPGSD